MAKGKRARVSGSGPRTIPTVDVSKDELRPTDKQFVLEYLSNGYNATAAYLACHPGVKRSAAAANGYKTLRRTLIARVIAREEQRRWKALEMSGDEAVALISVVGRADIAEAYDPATGRLLPVGQWPKRLRLAVKSVTDKGVTLHDALRARGMMAEMHGRMQGEFGEGLGRGLAALAKVLTGAFTPDEDTDG